MEISHILTSLKRLQAGSDTFDKGLYYSNFIPTFLHHVPFGWHDVSMVCLYNRCRVQLAAMAEVQANGHHLEPWKKALQVTWCWLIVVYLRAQSTLFQRADVQWLWRLLLKWRKVIGTAHLASHNDRGEFTLTAGKTDQMTTMLLQQRLHACQNTTMAINVERCVHLPHYWPDQLWAKGLFMQINLTTIKHQNTYFKRFEGNSKL